MSNAKRDAMVVALHDQGLSDREAARRAGVGQSTARLALYRARRRPDHSRDHLGDQFDAVMAAWENGASVQDLADMVGRSLDAMKWTLAIMKAYGHITDRPVVAHNKGRHMPMHKKHQVVFDKMMAVPGWDKMKRGEMAAALKMPVNVFILYWRTFRNRGLVGPKAQGKTPGSAADVRAASRRLTSGSDKDQNLWATALGRRTI